MKLAGKVIIVTGGNGQLGTVIVDRIRKEGGTCINADLHATTNVETGDRFCDITNEESIRETIKAVQMQYGKIDGLVNNAYPRTADWGKKFEDIPYASWQKNVDMQMNSTFYFCQQILPFFQQNGSGSIVNISSIYGCVGPDFTVYDRTEMTSPAAYAAIKGGVINFSRYLASYAGKFNIRVNTVSPGGIYHESQNKEFVKNYEAKVPMRRMGRPADIAPAVAFLLSDEAGYITGTNLLVDGGWTAI